MTSSALLTLIAIVASVEGGLATIQGEHVQYLRPGDVGRLQYEITVGSEARTIDVGTAEVIRVGDSEATLRIESDRQAQAGFGVRFELPLDRVETGDRQPHPKRTASAGVEAPKVEPDVALQLESMVLAWAAVWSAQDAEAYLGFYAQEYVPTNGMTREQWATQRRQRLVSPEFLNVAIEGFEVVSPAEGGFQVRFEQTYRSNTFEDQVTKTLRLVLEDGTWKIGAEEATPVR